MLRTALVLPGKVAIYAQHPKQFVLGVVLFAYKAFAGVGSLLSGGFILLYCLASTVISFILYLVEKP